MNLLTMPPKIAEISQTDMANVHTFHNHIRRLTIARDRVLESILKRYEQGAAVEPGVFDMDVVETRGGASKTVKGKVL